MAARFWIGGGTNTNWNASPTTNWAASSGDTTRVAAPTISDDVTFDGVGTNANTASVVSAGQNIISLTFTSGYTNTITINTGVVLQTNAGNFTDNTAHSWVVNGTGSLVLIGACTINSGGKTFPGPVQFSTASTKTLSVDWTITGTLTNSSTTVLNGNILTIGGGLTTSAALLSGTTKLVFNGTGTLVTGGAPGVTNNIDINTAGTITMGNPFNFATGTLRLVAVGTLVSANGLTVAGTCTLDIAGATWALVTFSVTGTITVSSLITATVITINTGVAVTFAGTFGFTTDTLNINSAANNTQTFVNSVTYTINTALTANRASFANPVTVTSNDGTLRANIILLNASSTCNVVWISFTRINAAGGRPIVTSNGTVTDSINVASYTTVNFNPITTLNRGFRRYGLWDVNRRVIYQ